MLSRDVLNALWPKGAFWEPLAEDDYDLLLDGVAENSEAVRLDVDKIRYLRDPARTSILDDLEREFAVVPVPGATDAERRSRLAVTMFRRGELPTYEMLQEKLRDAGFDVYVYPNSPAVDPSIFIEQAFQMTCGDLLPSGNEAQCGEPEAYCGQVGGELLVNGDLYEQAPNYIILCDEALAQCGEVDAQCGNFDSIRLALINYNIPGDPGYWPLIFYVGGVATYSAIVFSSIKYYIAPENNWWFGLATDGAGTWIAVSANGTNRIMRSIDDGLTWTPIAAPEANTWNAIATDGAGVWCAVSGTGTNRIMRSDDNGLTWTPILAAAANTWVSIDTDGAGVWCAVSNDGANRVMRSTDNGLTWGSVAAAAANTWYSVKTDKAGVWVAVSIDGANRIMRSINNGANWSSIAAPEANSWVRIATDLAGTWIAVSIDGVHRIMRSLDNGATWGVVTAAEDNSWSGISFGNNIWVAVSQDGTNRVMRSNDNGATWESVALNIVGAWSSLTFGNDVFISTAISGMSRIMRISGVIINGISSIDIAPIPIERRLEFRRLILNHKPMASWAALVVVYQ